MPDTQTLVDVARDVIDGNGRPSRSIHHAPRTAHDHAVRDSVKPSDGETVLPDKRGYSHRGTAIRERAQRAQQQDPRCIAPNPVAPH